MCHKKRESDDETVDCMTGISPSSTSAAAQTQICRRQASHRSPVH